MSVPERVRAGAVASGPGLGSHHRALVEAAEIEPRDRVLDIGCGAGQTTRDVARRASAGWAMGINLSAGLLELAARLAEREGVRNVRFVRGDAQVYPFDEGTFDAAVSRMGGSCATTPTGCATTRPPG